MVLWLIQGKGVGKFYNIRDDNLKEIIKDIRKKACYVPFNFTIESEPFHYELPDGEQIIIKDRTSALETLIKPSNIKREGKGIAEICHESIQKCDVDIKKDLYHNIVLSGGISMHEGLLERFTKELKYFAPQNMEKEMRVIETPNSQFLSYLGGCILASVSTFKSISIKKKRIF